jgi:2,3-bisphosphoglycerate-independent phosphoglycerate mutase
MAELMQYGRPVVLMILDGWGERPPAPDNAISQAQTPHWDRLRARSDLTLLTTHGPAVGLPEGQMGNSEVGHLNIGAGRIVYQDFTRIGRAIEDGDYADNATLLGLIESIKTQGGTLHLMGLLSPGGVHSHQDHLLATIEMAHQNGLDDIAVHAFLDGRDCPPRSAQSALQRLQQAVDRLSGARVSSVSGRYYAMDRDHRWDRTEQAWRAMAEASGVAQADSAEAALVAAYQRGEDDEFVTPTVIGKGAPLKDGDGVFIFNFRADRVRQLASVLCDQTFDGFERGPLPALVGVVSMTQLDDDLCCEVVFPPQAMEDLLGATVAAAGLSQLRIAETEKYAHVTYFFNGGNHAPGQGESRILVPSPQVATYDLQPEMSSAEVCKQLCAAIQSGAYDLIIANMANPDMVGHTGSLSAAITAVEAIDGVVGAVAEAITAVGGELVITADHGNAEQMADPETGQPHTAHTLNPVPLIHHGQHRLSLRAHGSLCDIAPTLLDLLGLDQPAAMTGRSLIQSSTESPTTPN